MPTLVLIHSPGKVAWKAPHSILVEIDFLFTNKYIRNKLCINGFKKYCSQSKLTLIKPFAVNWF